MDEVRTALTTLVKVNDRPPEIIPIALTML
jgi:hypothetical protein